MTATSDDERLICEADKPARTIKFKIRSGFGNGANRVDAAQERARLHAMLDEAIDVIIGAKQSVVPVERWVEVRFVDK